MSLNTQVNPVTIDRPAADVTNAVRAASARSGVKFSYLMAQASLESGFRPDAKSPTSSAAGLYQFIKSTWLDMVRTHGAKYGLGEYAKALQNGTADDTLQKKILSLRSDPKLSASMAAEYARSNKMHLEKTVGGKIGDTELYLAHFLGPTGAERFLKGMRGDAAKPAADAFPEAAQANKTIFYDNGRARSYAEVRQIFAAKIDGSSALASAAPASLPPPPPPPPSLRHIAFIPELSHAGSAVPRIDWLAAGAPASKLAPANELLLMHLKSQSAGDQSRVASLF